MESKSIINNEFDYSNILPTVDCIKYLISYCDRIYKQFVELVKKDEEKNLPFKPEYKNYIYGKSYNSGFEIYIAEKTYNNISCNGFFSIFNI